MFEVGKKVICIKDGSGESVLPLEIKKGEVYDLLGIRQASCCKQLLLDIGHFEKDDCDHECECGFVEEDMMGKQVWYTSRFFAPFDDSLSDTTAEELI